MSLELNQVVKNTIIITSEYIQPQTTRCTGENFKVDGMAEVLIKKL